MNHLFQLKTLSAILLIAMCFYSANGFAQTQGKKKTKVAQQQTVIEHYGNTVTLVTSGSGSNEDEATRNALRNAIEQAFGTFVSSNTTLVNDELVGDVISSVSSGDVLGYEIISSLNTSQGFSVSVKAVVSIGKLVSFATSHGMKAELAGNTFLMNKKLARLNKENERTALRNLIDQLSIIARKGMYDYSVEVSQPRTNDLIVGSAEYAIDIKVNAKPNANYNLFWETIDRTLSSLSMSQTESANYKTLEMNTYEYAYVVSEDGFEISSKTDLVGTKSWYILRNSIEDLLDVIKAWEIKGKFGYELYDNIGNIVTPVIYDSSNISDELRILYEIDDFRMLHTRCSVILKETCSINHRLSRAYRDGEKGKFGHDFVMQYSESELSNLRNISIRPHLR